MKVFCGLVISIPLVFISFSQYVGAEEVNIDVHSTVNGTSTQIVNNRVVLSENTNTSQNTVRVEVNEQNTQEKKDELKDKLETKQEELEQRKDEMKEKIASRQADLKNTLDEKSKERVRVMYSAHIRRLLAVSERLENFLGRMESRLEKSAGNSNADLTALVKKVTDLKQETAKLKADIALKVDSLDLVLDSSDPKTMYVVLRNELETYHQDLKILFGKIRGLLPELEKLHSKDSSKVGVTVSPTKVDTDN